jgi:large subunit ribosomal protein L16
MGGVPEATAREAMRLAAHKLPIKVKFVTKADFEKPEPAQEATAESPEVAASAS